MPARKSADRRAFQRSRHRCRPDRLILVMGERSGRFGLLGMRERVEGLGGTLTIEGGPGQGCSLTARIPMPERRKG